MTLSPDGPLARPRRPDDEGVGLVPAGEVPGEGDGHHGLGCGVGQQTGQQALGKHDFWKHWTFRYKVISGCAKEKSIDPHSSQKAQYKCVKESLGLVLVLCMAGVVCTA